MDGLHFFFFYQQGDGDFCSFLIEEIVGSVLIKKILNYTK